MFEFAGLLKKGGSETQEKPVGTFFILFIIKIIFIILDVYLKDLLALSLYNYSITLHKILNA